MVSVSDYIHNVNKDYWSGSFTLKYSGVLIEILNIH